MRFAEASLEELIPQPLPVETQAHALSRQLAIQRVNLLDTLDHELARASPVSPGTCSRAGCINWALIS